MSQLSEVDFQRLQVIIFQKKCREHFFENVTNRTQLY